MARRTGFYARISPHLAHRPGATQASRAHAWLLRRSNGRIGRRFIGAPVLVLRTTGRRSGQARESPMFFVRHDGGFAVVASNAASRRPPAWWLNLQAEPSAQALVDGRWHAVRGRRANLEEDERLWPFFQGIYGGYDHYREIASRELPVVILERVSA